MIRLYLNKEYSLHFSFFLFKTLNTKYPNSNNISSSVGIKDGLRFNYGPSTDFYVKTLNKFKVFWLKVVSSGSNHILGTFEVGNHKTNT